MYNIYMEKLEGIYLLPTPIGNLSDITLRTLEVLKNVDIIACEDTRTSKILLDRYEINKPLISFHKFNYSKQIPRILDELENGKTFAFISDAGMPGISDPGSEIVKAAIDSDFKVSVLPGASASIVAVVLSGLLENRFTFIGFLDQKQSRRLKELEDLKNYPDPLVFYESPHRIDDFLRDLYEVFGDRKISISRELTKIYEETLRGDLSEFVENPDLITKKGEFVIVVSGKKEEELEIDIKELLKNEIENGATKKDAVKTISKEYDLNKNEVYRASLEI